MKLFKYLMENGAGAAFRGWSQDEDGRDIMKFTFNSKKFILVKFDGIRNDK